jgi:hypothetical protein
MHLRGSTQEKVDPGPTAAEAAGRVLELSDVYLLTAASAGQDAVPGLRVVLDGEGMTVCRPDGSLAAGMQWPVISRLEARIRMATPEGDPGVVVEAEAQTRTHRFLVPTGDPNGLEREVDELAGAMVASRRRSRRRIVGRIVSVVSIVAIAVEIALIVLVATGFVAV